MINAKTTTSDYFNKFSYWIFIGLLGYMPLHIFLSTWLGTSFGILEITKGAKDIIMIFGFLAIATVALRDRQVKPLFQDRLIQVIIAYGLLTIILAIFRSTDPDAEVLGVVYNTRFLVFFLYGVLLAKTVDLKKLRKHSLIAVMASALVVLIFGLLQYTIIPNTALEHVGYHRSNGVLPAFFIDDKPDLERVMSTLRDPNSYGSYIIIIGSLALALLLKKPFYKRLATGFLMLTTLNLLFTFSRSAWIGFVLAVATCLIIFNKDKLKRLDYKKLVIWVAVALVPVCIFLALSWNTYFVQNVIFHADQSTVLEDPNELRVRFWKESLVDIASDPIGSGPGTAGLASIRNDVQGTELNENYYLQIASEVGILGIILFVAILVIVALRLYKLSNKDWLASALLASFICLTFTNFLVHIWSNEAVAYTWWGLAGIILHSSLFPYKKSTNK